MDTIATIIAIIGAILSAGIPLYFKFRKAHHENNVIHRPECTPEIDAIRTRVRQRLREQQAKSRGDNHEER